MNCPDCNYPLRQKKIQNVIVDECPKCGGIWFDKDELRQVKDASDSDLNWMDFEIWKHLKKYGAKKSERLCPHCNRQMALLNYENTNVEIDFCIGCQGIWLDKNELKNIIAALENELLTMSSGQYVKATLEEAKEILTGPEPFLSEWKDFTTVLRLLQYRVLSDAPKISEWITSIQQNPLNR